MQRVRFTDSLEGIGATMLEGFFVGWRARPTTDVFLETLKGSKHIWLALEDGQVVGFINAISDGVMAAFIPLLEVLPSHQGRGIGRELVTKMLQTLETYYSIDLLCDDDLVAFYEKFDLIRSNAMYSRNYRPEYALRHQEKTQ
jgi:ribosomal protein S18 acetylase RimI-like enzyme